RERERDVVLMLSFCEEPYRDCSSASDNQHLRRGETWNPERKCWCCRSREGSCTAHFTIFSGFLFCLD
ncbi:hypothetical protein IRJ41_015166, partial [Triplophysa rosa]